MATPVLLVAKFFSLPPPILSAFGQVVPCLAWLLKTSVGNPAFVNGASNKPELLCLFLGPGDSYNLWAFDMAFLGLSRPYVFRSD